MNPMLIFAIVIAAVLVIILGIVLAIKMRINAFYNSDTFLRIRQETEGYVRECNELNAYIESLKRRYIDCGTGTDYATTELFRNTGFYNYGRKHLQNYTNSPHTCNCSLQVLKSARDNPFKYLCKYFSIKADEPTLAYYEQMMNDYLSVQQGVGILETKYAELIQKHSGEIPGIVLSFDKKGLREKLNYHQVDLSQGYMPRYTFSYISAGGNSGQSFDIVLDVPTLQSFTAYLMEKIKFSKSAEGQRRLMTSQLRQKIKERDNYTCRYCGISVREEPHLLLEIDHIIPVSKGGITTEENLQTLCWKCNRSKGTKMA